MATAWEIIGLGLYFISIIWILFSANKRLDKRLIEVMNLLRKHSKKQRAS